MAPSSWEDQPLDDSTKQVYSVCFVWVLFCVIVDLCLCNVCVCFYGHVVFGWMFLYSFNLLVQLARGTTWFLVKNPTQN